MSDREVTLSLTVNGSTSQRHRASDGATARCPPAAAASHRHEGRLRRGRVRRVRGAHRRRAREQLPRSRSPGRRRDRDDDRGSGGRRSPARRAGGIRGAWRRAVRHLHAGDGSCRGESPSPIRPNVDEEEIRNAAVRQSVPLHRLHEDFRGRAQCGRGVARTARRPGQFACAPICHRSPCAGQERSTKR